MPIILDFYGDLDLHDGQLKNTKIEQLPSPPVNPETSRIYFNTTDSKFHGYNGLEWKTLESLSDDILSAINGATNVSTPKTIVLRDENGSFEGDFYDGIDMHGSEIKSVLAEKLPDAPTNPLKGQFYFNTTSGGFYGYDGTIWCRLDYDSADALSQFYTKAEIDTTNATLQSQIDGNIQTWFGIVPPSTINEPYTIWTTDTLKNKHLGDLYSDTNTGYWYRFLVNANVYQWSLIPDTDVTKALADAATAQATADSKKRVFSITPTPPYDIGDLWTQGSSGDLMRCKTAIASGGTYSSAHWERAFKWDMARSTYDTNASGVVDNSEKVNGLSVQTAVPAGAVFTDTVTSINGKTGVITKADIVALGIPAQDTVYVHPTTTGYLHIPSGGTDGQFLKWSADGTATWSVDNNTTYPLATGLLDGLISSSDFTKLSGIATGANAYTHPSYTSYTSGLYKVTIDTLGHVSNAISVAKSDITDLGIPAQDTVYTLPSSLPASIIAQDANNRFVTDNQATNWGTAYTNSHTHSNKTILDKITTGVATSYNLDNFVTSSQLADLGGGDMLKSVYDTTNNGIVDNSEKVNGLTVQTAVPTGALFTDTIYTPPTYTAYVSGIYKITTNTLGHVSSATSVAKEDITALGIPASDTTYSVATTSINGLMSSADKTKIDAIIGTNTGDQTLSSFGITSTASELNVLDGITSTVAELNYTDGVTSNIQTQLDSKLSSASYTASDILTKLKTVDGASSGLDADLLDGNEASAFAPVSHGTHVTYGTTTTSLTSGETGIIGSDSTLARSDHTHTLPSYPTLSSLGITSTSTQLNYSNSVTSSIQTQLDEKALDSDLLGLEYSKFSSYATNIDANKIYVNSEWKRADATTYCKSTLVGTSPNYNQVKIDYYDTAGTTIINTITWNLTYDTNNFSYQKVVV